MNKAASFVKGKTWSRQLVIHIGCSSFADFDDAGPDRFQVDAVIDVCFPFRTHKVSYLSGMLSKVLDVLMTPV